jgi:hypothetical protein
MNMEKFQPEYCSLFYDAVFITVCKAFVVNYVWNGFGRKLSTWSCFEIRMQDAITVDRLKSAPLKM